MSTFWIVYIVAAILATVLAGLVCWVEVVEEHSPLTVRFVSTLLLAIVIPAVNVFVLGCALIILLASALKGTSFHSDIK